MCGGDWEQKLDHGHFSVSNITDLGLEENHSNTIPMYIITCQLFCQHNQLHSYYHYNKTSFVIKFIACNKHVQKSATMDSRRTNMSLTKLSCCESMLWYLDFIFLAVWQHIPERNLEENLTKVPNMLHNVNESTVLRKYLCWLLNCHQDIEDDMIFFTRM